MKNYLILGVLLLFAFGQEGNAQILIKDEVNPKSLRAFQQDPENFLVNWKKGNLIAYHMEFEDKEMSKKFQEGVPVLFQASIQQQGKEVYTSKPVKAQLFPGSIFFPGTILFPENIIEKMAPGSYELQIKMQVMESKMSEQLSKYPRVIPIKFKL